MIPQWRLPADALLECEGNIDPEIGYVTSSLGGTLDAFNKNVLGLTSKIALNAIRDGKPSWRWKQRRD